MQTFSEKCPIWGTDASEDGKNLSADKYWYDSPRAGGKFEIDGTSIDELMHFSIAQKVALTDWLVKQRRMGVDCPTVELDVSKSFLSVSKISVIERMNRAIVWIGSWLHTPGDKFCLGNDFTMVIMDVELKSTSDRDAPYFFAAIGSEAVDDDEGILRLLHDAGYLRPSDGQTFKARSDLFVTPSGWQKYAELAERDALGSQAFVAMWFGKSMDEAYENGFAAGILDAGYIPLRIDRVDHNNKIDDEIIAEIRRSKFLVADFTSELIERARPDGVPFKDTFARGGVYFEAGFAKGLGKDVIWTVRQDVMEAGVLHFDTRQFAHIVWKDAADLRSQLSKRISATLSDGPNKRK